MTKKNRLSIPLGEHLFCSLLIACLLLDFFDVWGKTDAPNLVRNFVCSVRPYTSHITNLVFSSQLINFAADQCQLGQPQEPVFSIILFMTKTCLAIAMIILLWGLMFLSPPSFQTIQDRYFNRLREKGNVYAVLKESIFMSGGFGLFSFYWFVRLSLFKTPDKFNIDLLHKFLEDFVVILAFFSLATVSVNSYLTAFFLMRKKRSVDSG